MRAFVFTRLVVVVGTLLMGLVLLTCQNDSGVDAKEEPPPVSGTVEGQVDEALSSILDFSTLSVVMPGSATSVTGDGAFSTAFHDGATDSLESAIVTVLQGGAPVLFSVAFSDNAAHPLGARPTLGARSTALALVLMNPLFIGAHDQARLDIATWALQDAGFSSLVADVETALQNAASTYLDTTTTYTGIYSKAAQIAINIFDAQSTSTPQKQAVGVPYLEMVEDNRLRIVNPCNIHFGVGIKHYENGQSIDHFMLRQCGLKWGWFTLNRLNTEKLKTLADGRYRFVFFKGFNFETHDVVDVFNPLHPAGMGTWANTAQTVLNFLEVAGTEFVDSETLEILIDNVNRLSGLTALGEALAAGDVVTFMDKGILFLYDNLTFIVQLLKPDMDAEELADYLGPITNQLKNLAAPLKLKNAIEKLPFFKDLVFVSAYESINMAIENGEMTPIAQSDIIVTEPKASTVWTQGDAQVAVRWETGSLDSEVLIDLYRGDALVDVISNGTENDGLFEGFTVPDTLSPDENFRVLVTPENYPSRADFSPFFTVAANSSDPYEPNDSRYAATEIALSGSPAVWQSASGTEIHAGNDRDWYAFDAEEGHTLEIHCDVTSDLDAQIAFYRDDAGASVLIGHHDNGWAGSDEIIDYTVPAGEGGIYYVGIGHFSTEKALHRAANTGSYALTVTRTAVSVDPYEPNDDYAHAHPLALSDVILTWESGAGPVIDPSTDQDWFALQLHAGDVVTVDCDVTSELDAEIVLHFDGAQVKDRDSGGSGSDETLVYTVPPGAAGVYYIGLGYYGNIEKRLPQSASTGSYALTVSVVRAAVDPFEPNDTPGTAYAVTLSGSPLSWESGAGPGIHPATDQDWFAVDLEAGDVISVWIDVTSDLDAEIVLYYNGSQVEDTDDLGSGQDGVLTYTVPGGASGRYEAGIGYYSHIEKRAPASADEGSYELAIDVLRSGSSDPFEPNDTVNEAETIYITGGSWESGPGPVIDPATDQDWFVLPLSAGETLTVHCTVTSDLDAEIVLYYHGSRVENVDAGYSGEDETLVYTVPSGDWGGYHIGIGYYGGISKSSPQMASTGSYLLSVTVSASSGDIVVTQPNSTTVWTHGDQDVPITWETGALGGDVEIALYKGSARDRTIRGNTPNNGAYTIYDVGATLTPGSDYRVKVSSLSYSAKTDYSDYFTVESPVSNITVTQPSSSTVWTQGDENVSIAWDTGNMDGYVKVELYKGSTLNQTVTSRTFNDGSYAIYDVSTDQPAGTDYRIKVTSIDYAGKEDYSDYFTIRAYSGYETGTMTDIDGNVYQTVKIGNQWWMAENLKVTHYRNGEAIPHVLSQYEWRGLDTGAYCYFDNDTDNISTYGLLYNWFAVDDSRNLAPPGWHVPTVADMAELMDYLGGEAVAGGKLKEAGTAHWNYPNTGADNSSGFTALPGGMRAGDGYYDLRGGAYFWTSEENIFNNRLGFYNHLDLRNATLGSGSFPKYNGFSIRLVKD